MNRLFNRLMLAIGAPMLLLAVLGGAAVMAQEGTGTPDTETPEGTTVPDDSTTPESNGGSDDEKDSGRSKDGCDKEGRGWRGGDSESDDGSETSAAGNV